MNEHLINVALFLRDIRKEPSRTNELMETTLLIQVVKLYGAESLLSVNLLMYVLQDLETELDIDNFPTNFGDFGVIRDSVEQNYDANYPEILETVKEHVINVLADLDKKGTS